MIFPLNANKIEQLELDPEKVINGYIWYNTVEKVYKTWIDGVLNVFITDHTVNSIMVDKLLLPHQFTISFSNAHSVIIKHNKKTKNFNYNVYDTIDNCNLYCSLEIIDENEVNIDFVDPVTGHIFMYFE
jgi:hypothetical protein